MIEQAPNGPDPFVPNAIPGCRCMSTIAHHGSVHA